jgi:arylsulfatase A-like enzyme/Tfp pilus assembly protein PilF
VILRGTAAIRHVVQQAGKERAEETWQHPVVNAERRRRKAEGFIVAILLLSLQCGREHRRTNVLLITLDTFRADRIGPLTPNLVRLTANGLQFTQADSAVPLTLPSHATLLSGLLPLHHGLRNNGAGVFPSNRETLAVRFGASGYRTAAFVSAFVLDHRFGLDRGFEVYDDEVPRQPEQSASFTEAERRGGETVDRALRWLRNEDKRPWFAWVHLYDAHAPYAPPEPFPPTYDGEVRYVDQQVGRLIDAVDQANTIIIVVGDHGEGLGEHGELTHGLFVYESTLHVPFILAGAGIRKGRIGEPVSLADVAPTICAFAVVECATGDGRNALSSADKRLIYSETRYPLTFGWKGVDAVRKGSIKVTSSQELFDLTRDPHEQTNAIDGQRRLYADLRTRLGEMQATALPSRATPVDSETARKLASLGYVAPRAAQQQIDHAPSETAALFRRFEEATEMLARRQPREAAGHLAALVRDDPANPVFRSTLARALRESGDLQRAIALYRQAVAIAPEDADAWYNLASALQESGDSAEASVVIAEAAKRDPNRSEVHNLRGTAAAEAGDLATAEKEFRAAIALDSRDARAYNNLGNVLRATNRQADSAAAYRKAIEIAPRYADPHNGLGALLAQAGNPLEALTEFDAALRMAPDHYEAQLNRGIALQLAGRDREARDEWRRLLERLPAGRAFERQRGAARALLAQPER